MSGSRKKYFKEDLEKAVGAVKRNHLSIRKASEVFKVPAMTISDHVTGKVESFKNPGPSRCLSPQDESALVRYIVYMAERGLSLSRKQIKCFVRQIVTTRGSETLLNLESGPSDLWFRKFYARHPEIKEGKAQRISTARHRMSNETVINQYFKLLDETLTKLNIKDKPAQIFNCDETGFGSEEKARQKVTGPRTKTHLTQQRVTTTDHTTALICVSADGRVLPSFVIFSKGIPHTDFRMGVPDNWLFSSSPSGFIDGELFLKWMEKSFIPNCGRERPVVLLMDNVAVHITLDIIEMAIANQVELIGFPPHTTHILQPCDVGVFGPLKKRFDELAVSLAYVNTGLVIGKAKLPTVLAYAIGQSCSSSVVQSAFEKTGIYPINKDAIDHTMVVPPDYSKPKKKPAAVSETVSPLCETCGQWVVPHPLVSQGMVSPSLARVFLPPNPREKPAKKRKVVTEARVLTSADFLRQMKDRDEEDKRKKEDKVRRKEQAAARKTERQEKQRKRQEVLVAAEQVEEDTEPCMFCGSHDLEGEGEAPVQDWIQCDACLAWYHMQCVDITQTPEHFMCTDMGMPCLLIPVEE